MSTRPPLGKMRSVAPIQQEQQQHEPEQDQLQQNYADDNETYDEHDAMFNSQDAERDAIEAGRRMAQEQQQRLLQQHSDASANRQQHRGSTTPSSNGGQQQQQQTTTSTGKQQANTTNEVDTIRRNLIHTTSALDKERAKTKELQLSLSTMQVEMTAMKRELAVVHRVSAPGGAGAQAVNPQAKEIATLKRQLQLAQNEIELLKSKQQQQQDGNSAVAHSAGTSDENVAKLRSEVRSLETQRAELLNVVKKQNRLIDVLRRQKMHLEAAKLLQITEDEFRRALQMEQH